jgi:hypothetical protein
MSFLGRTPFKSFTSRIRPYSHCHYDTGIPSFSLFVAGVATGGFFTTLILCRMNSDIQYHYQEYEAMKAELKEIKGILGNKK